MIIYLLSPYAIQILLERYCVCGSLVSTQSNTFSNITVVLFDLFVIECLLRCRVGIQYFCEVLDTIFYVKESFVKILWKTRKCEIAMSVHALISSWHPNQKSSHNITLEFK